MGVAVLRKRSDIPVTRSDRVVLFADENGVVWARGAGVTQLLTDDDLDGLDYAPVVHGHSIADVSGLQAALDAKAPAGSTGITIGTAVATTSGTSHDFPGIPAGVRRITVSFSGVSTNGTSNYILQIGDSGGIEATGYTGANGTNGATAITNFTTGYLLNTSVLAAGNYSGVAILTLVDAATFTWSFLANTNRNDAGTIFGGSGMKTLSAELDRLRLTTVGGTDAFDAGSINISYES